MSLADTIFAQSTPPGISGVAVVRLTGAKTRSYIEHLCKTCPPPREARVRMLRYPKTGAQIDQALLLWLPGPSSFTGEDMAELHCHGSIAALQLVTQALISLGCRPAEPGEFSRRALDHGKLDLIAAEALDQLLHARDPATLRIAQGQAGLARQRLFDDWRQILIRLLAACEALVDFPDEDLPGDLVQQNQAALDDLADQVSDLEARSRLARAVTDGLEILLVGPPNVGKSTLLNAVAGYEKAIVTQVPGTTRDFVEVDVQLGAFAVKFVDTAGLRETTDTVERVGIERTRGRFDTAALILNLHEPDASPLEIETQQPVWQVQSKAFKRNVRSVAAGEPDAPGVQELLKDIEAWLETTYGPALTDLSLQKDRQMFHVKHLHMALLAAQDTSLLPELQAEHLRHASLILAQLSGTVHAEEVLDALFSGFCIGK